jgi:hypothetical protein
MHLLDHPLHFRTPCHSCSHTSNHMQAFIFSLSRCVDYVFTVEPNVTTQQKKSILVQIKQCELALITPYCHDDRKEMEQNKLNKLICQDSWCVIHGCIMLPWDIFLVISVAIINTLCVNFEIFWNAIVILFVVVWIETFLRRFWLQLGSGCVPLLEGKNIN